MTKTITLYSLLFFLALGCTLAQENFQVQFKNQFYEPQVVSKPTVKSLQAFGGRRYGLIQFQTIPSETVKKDLQAAGVELLDYIPSLTWFFSAPSNLEPAQVVPGVRAVFPLLPAHKMDEAILNRTFPNWATKESGKLDVSLLLFRKEDTQSQLVLNKITQAGNKILSIQESFQIIKVRIDPDNIDALAAEPWLQWMEPVSPDAVKENLPGKVLHRSNVLENGARNLTGNNVRVAIWDGGAVGSHLDFGNRLTLEENAGFDDHGSHVMGTIGGAGLLNPTARGMAPNSTLFSYDFFGDVPFEMLSAIPARNLILTSHSYGFGNAFVNCVNGDPYNSNSRNQDIVLFNAPNVVHVHSSGNSQSVCAGGWRTTTGKAAKNMIVVANVTTNEAMSTSSSFGPVQDGRIKPEISGMGTNVFSTTPDNSYMTMSGTSMATPGVSGTIAQLIERYRQLNSNADPRSSLVKALVCNTAKDRGNAGPDYRFGYGTINGLKAVRAVEENRFELGSLANGGTNNRIINVPAGTAQVRVMITWLDPPGASNANPALINNLNLTVTDPGATVFNPWILNPANPGNVATRGVDNVNNIEQVTISNPVAGNYTISINGASVPSGPQQYALTWEFDNNGIEIVYPNGGEVLQPGTNAGLVFWDTYGVSGNQTIEYSTNNGSNWVVLGTVASTVNAVSWTVPAVVSNQYLMRVSQGALTDQSDATFSVIGTPTGLSLSQGCNSGELVINWNAVTGAIQYDVMKLDTVNSVWNVFAADIATTSFTATGLATNQRHWFSVTAKANALSVIGQRSAAVGTLNQHVNPFTVNVLADATSGCAPFSTTLRTVVPANNYTAINPGFSTISGTETNITTWSGNADDGFALVGLPFPFKFYNNDYTSVYVSTNGFISFGAGSPVGVVQAFPNASTPNNVVALCFADLDLTISGTCGYYVTGVAPNRRFVIQYANVPPYSGTGTFTGQLVLFEGSNLIDMNITSQNLSGSKTQGVENVNGTSATTVAGRNGTNWTATNDSRRFVPTLTGATYTWTPGTALSSTTVQNPSITNLNSSVSYGLTVVYNGCTVNGSMAITVNNVPPQPGVITGTASVCEGNSGNYSISSVAGATSYTWSLPGDWLGTSSTTSINATIGSNSGNASVAGVNACGTGTARTFATTAYSSVPSQPGAITGNALVCSGSTQPYSIAAVAGAISYTWTLPSGWSGTSTTTNISTTPSTNSGNVSVSASNACGIGTSQTLPVSASAIPAQPGIMSGTTPVCNGTTNTYTIAAVSGATSYNWTLPSGWTGTSSTESINATASATSGTISVTATNFCGTGIVRNLAVTSISIPGLPGAITGLASVCNGSTNGYSIGAVSGATGYVWTLPSGWSGSSTTTSISAIASANAGDVTVAASNTCGSGPDRTLAVSVISIPAQPGAITGNNDICNGSSQAYSVSPVSGATSYLWTLPSGWTGTSTTTSISPTASANSGSVSVRATNSCGNSSVEMLAVSVTSIPAQPGIMSGTTPVCNGTTNTYTIGTVSGASSYNWTLPSGWTGTSSTESINATASATSGTISVTATNFCGTGIVRNLAVSSLSIPAQAGPISGSAIVVSGVPTGYSILPVPEATSYVWALPSGWNGTSSSTSITVTPDLNSGTLSVSAQNICGTGVSQSLFITSIDPGSGLEVNNWLGLFNTPIANNWQNPANWSSGNGVPSSIQMVRIANNTPFPPQISDGANAGEIVLVNGAEIQFTTGLGRLQVLGDWRGTTGQVIGPGSVALIGNQSQTFYGTTDFQNLFIQKTGGQVQVLGTARIKGLMQFENANSNVSVLPGGKLIFHSDPIGTGKLGPVPVGVSIIGNVTMERHIASGNKWFFLSTPVTGNNFSDWGQDFRVVGPASSASGTHYGSQSSVWNVADPKRATIFVYDESTHHTRFDTAQKIGWKISPNSNIIPGVGYRVYIDNHSLGAKKKFNNVGTVVTGEVNMPVSRTEYTSCVPSAFPCLDFTSNFYRGWNLLGNPFPCDLNWDATGPETWTKPSQMQNSFWRWNATGSGYGVYVGNSNLWSGAGPAPANPNVIPSSQGFFVRLTAPGNSNTTLTVNENAKSTTSAGGNFLRNAFENNLLRVALSKIGESEYDYTGHVAFSPDATDGIDVQGDFGNLGTHHYSFSFVVDNNALVFTTFGELNDTKVVPMRMSYAGATGVYRLKLSNLESFNPGVEIFLRDKRENRLIPAASTEFYEFGVHAASISDVNRFEIIFSYQPVLSIAKDLSVGGLRVYPNPTKKNKPIQVVFGNKGFGTTAMISLTNLVGQEVYRQEIITKEVGFTEHIIENIDLPSGTYTVKVLGNTNVLTTKVAIN